MSEKEYNRRRFLKDSSAIVGGLSLAGLGMPMEIMGQATSSEPKSLKLGFVGIGGRGSYHLDVALGMEGIEIPAMCEIK